MFQLAIFIYSHQQPSLLLYLLLGDVFGCLGMKNPYSTEAPAGHSTGARTGGFHGSIYSVVFLAMFASPRFVDYPIDIWFISHLYMVYIMLHPIDRWLILAKKHLITPSGSSRKLLATAQGEQGLQRSQLNPTAESFLPCAALLSARQLPPRGGATGVVMGGPWLAYWKLQTWSELEVHLDGNLGHNNKLHPTDLRHGV